MAQDKHRHFLIVFLSGSLALLIVLSLVPTAEKPNLLGHPGTSVAFYLYKSFGLWAWVFPFLFLRLAVKRFRDEAFHKPGLKVLGVLLGISSLCVALYVLFPEMEMFSAAQMREGVKWSGELGRALGSFLESVLTRFGAGVVCFLLLVFSAWLLEKEEHLMRAAKGSWEGSSRTLLWLKDHGFEAYVELHEKALQAFNEWRARQGEKKVAQEARRKIEKEVDRAKPTGRPDPASLRPSPATVISPAPAKPSSAFFTGDEEEVASVPAPAPRASRPKAAPKPAVEEDVVSAALAEAKAADPMTLRQKMEAASIEMADEEEKEEPQKPTRLVRSWQLPSPHILRAAEEIKDKVTADFEGVSRTIIETLANFGVEARVVGVNPGPTVTQYEVQPAAGVKINSIASLSDDLALALQCGHLRIVAPIPGKAAVGIEVPNIQGRVVTLKELIAQEGFLNSPKKLLSVLGRDIAGDGINASIKEMPHVLVAGSTGSGKSVCVNTLIASLIFKHDTETLRMVLIDPKRVEMAIYRGLPHLALPVVNDPKEAAAALKWLVREMEERYEALAHVGARDIDTYNAKMAQKREGGDASALSMYYIVVLVDELADLMMTAKDQVEDSITRLAQMARAVGIHLVLATQRPSVEVITGIIKANFPSRIAFQVFSKVDSRTILDMNGAEALVGKGDMLYLASGAPKPVRLQGAYVTLEEIERLVEFWTSQGGPDYSADLSAAKSKDLVTEESEDELYEKAKEIVLRSKKASTSLLQRRLNVGYSRAARLLDDMEMRGVVGPAEGNKPRKILVQTLEGGGDFEDEGMDDENNG